MDQVAIRPMTEDDAPAVATLHALTLLDPWGRMGSAFLRIVYREMVRLREVALVGTIDGRVIGFAAGSDRPGQFFAALLRRQAIPLAFSAVPALIHQPAIIPRFARGVRKPADASRPTGTATLLFIAVSRDCQRHGVGRLLVDAFVRESAARGAVRIDLQTDRRDNHAANAFYRRLGFRLAVARNAGNRPVNLYELEPRMPVGSVRHDVVLDAGPDRTDQTGVSDRIDGHP